MADQVAGYPTSGLERFVTGFQSGYEKMTDIQKKSAELKEKLAMTKAMENKPAKGIGGDSSTTREVPYDTGLDTTGSGGGSGGSGGSISSFDPSQTGDGHAVPKSERIEAYNQIAKEFGLNPHAFLMTADKEGLHKYVGDKGMSFGDFQLYTGGGMGNLALNAGINVRDPKTWLAQARFVAQQMAAHKGDAKWFAGQWHGPRDYAPWAVHNFSNPDAPPPGGSAASNRPPGMSTGSNAPVPGAPVRVGGPGSEGYGTSAPAAAPPAAAPAAAIGSVPNFSQQFRGQPPDAGPLGTASQGVPRMIGRPQQMSALGGPGGQPQQPPPDIYNRPQSPPQPSVLAQLVGQQYLPQLAALSPAQQRDNLYSGLA